MGDKNAGKAGSGLHSLLIAFMLLITVPMACFMVLVLGGLALTTIYVLFNVLLGGN